MVISGWKDIAKYLNCGVRTAQRWAQSNGLPIHRPLQDKRGPVLALSKDLEKWIQRGRGKTKPPDGLISRHQRIILALRHNLDEYNRLLNLLREERARQIYQRHPR